MCVIRTFVFIGGFSSQDFQWNWRNERIPDCVNANQWHEEEQSGIEMILYAQLNLEKGLCLTEHDNSSVDNIICKLTGT